MKLLIRDNSKTIFETTSLNHLDFAEDRAVKELIDMGVEDPSEEEVRQHIERSPRVNTVSLEQPEDPWFHNDFNAEDPYAAAVEVGELAGEGLENPYVFDTHQKNPKVDTVRAKLIKVSFSFGKNGQVMVRAGGFGNPWGSDREVSRSDNSGFYRACRYLSQVVNHAMDSIRIGNFTLRSLVKKYTMQGLLMNKDYRLRQATYDLRQELKLAFRDMDPQDKAAFLNNLNKRNENEINFADILLDGTLSYTAGKKFTLNKPNLRSVE